MKRIVCSLVIGLTLLVASLAQAYMVDGLLGDWGVNIGVADASVMGYLNTNLPSGGLDIDVITEDNAGPQTGWQYVGPGYSYYGNQFDTEAIYFDNNGSNAFLAVVTGFPIGGATAPGNPWFNTGDIGLDLNNDGIYEYGIDVKEYDAVNKKAKLYKNLTLANWDNVYYSQFAASNPWQIKNGGSGTFDWIDFVYSGVLNTHYVLEAGIPLSSLGLNSGSSQNLKVHWTMQCGNDVLTLPADVNPVPEPGTMVLFGSGIFGLLATSFRRFFRQIKRGMDIVMAGLAVIITAPLWIAIAIAIKLTSKGPIFFNQERVGENKRYSERRKESRGADRRTGLSFGRSFIMYKFRTMKIDAEKETGAVWCQENDPRITTVGRFLRKTHLDELPQLINVLLGQMSMIGPRPERAQIIPILNKSIKKYNKRLRIKPGITGLAQVRQHYDSTLSDVKKKVHYDLLYIRKMCLIMDLRIIFGTFVVMLTGKGAR
ncbi:MAG: sugar transferase [bacterium]|nr:sugar transferase [bacterium]